MLDPDRAEAKKDEVAQSVSNGFELAAIFYEGLRTFEESGEPFDQFSRRLLLHVGVP